MSENMQNVPPGTPSPKVVATIEIHIVELPGPNGEKIQGVQGRSPLDAIATMKALGIFQANLADEFRKKEQPQPSIVPARMGLDPRALSKVFGGH
jgi:hypothetical protein